MPRKVVDQGSGRADYDDDEMVWIGQDGQHDYKFSIAPKLPNKVSIKKGVRIETVIKQVHQLPTYNP